MKRFRISTLLFGAVLMLVSAVLIDTARAEDKGAKDLAKASQNPVSSLISVPFEDNVNFNAGPGKGTNNVLNIKPVYPLSLTENWNLINRAIVPLIYLDEQEFDVPTPMGVPLTVKVGEPRLPAVLQVRSEISDVTVLPTILSKQCKPQTTTFVKKIHSKIR